MAVEALRGTNQTRTYDRRRSVPWQSVWVDLAGTDDLAGIQSHDRPAPGHEPFLSLTSRGKLVQSRLGESRQSLKVPCRKYEADPTQNCPSIGFGMRTHALAVRRRSPACCSAITIPTPRDCQIGRKLATARGAAARDQRLPATRRTHWQWPLGAARSETPRVGPTNTLAARADRSRPRTLTSRCPPPPAPAQVPRACCC